MILLDTDVMIDLFRHYPPAVSWLDALGEEEVLLPGFVVMELIQGARNQLEQNKIAKDLQDFSVIWPSSEVCDLALSTFARFHLSHGLGIIDAIIGQVAISLDLPLNTFNQKHYEFIPNLKTFQPYERYS